MFILKSFLILLLFFGCRWKIKRTHTHTRILTFPLKFLGIVIIARTLLHKNYTLLMAKIGTPKVLKQTLKIREIQINSKIGL